MQKYAKIRTVLAKTCRNMQKICKKYAKICNKICRNMQKYANKICKNMQNICKNIRVYVFAYGAYICTPHFADDCCQQKKNFKLDVIKNHRRTNSNILSKTNTK
jgi:hypothetical protein